MMKWTGGQTTADAEGMPTANSDSLQEPGGLGSSPALQARIWPKRWVAVLVSLLCPGAGQLYCGFPKRALAILSVELLSLVGLRHLLAQAPYNPLFDLFVGFFPLLYGVVTTWDAWRCARKPSARRSNLMPVLAFTLLIWYVPAVVAEVLSADRFPVRTFFIPSGSMIPTIATGDYILVRMVPFEPKAGDIAVFEPPETYHGNKTVLVSRIVAVGGDEVEVRSHVLYINGAPKDESYIKEPIDEDYEKIRIPEGQYFMMGDNRNDAYDSRFWGPVPRDHLKGRVMSIFWGKQFARTGTPL
jgi:signal peptidase I